MKFKIIIEPDILAQLFSTSFFYDSQKIGLGAEFEGDVLEILNLISENPALYAIHHRDVRRALVERFNYHIYYLVVGPSVYVLEFRDARRDPPKYQG